MATTLTGLAHDDVARYGRDGYLFPLPVFTELEAAGWAATVLELARLGVPGHDHPWTQKSYLLLPTLDALIRDRRLTDVVAAVLGDDLLVLSADLFVKPGGSHRRITWHQDVNFWQLEPLEVLTAWVALTPATRENGGMRYVAGGHHGRVVHAEHPDPGNMLSRGQEIAVAVDERGAVDVALRPGQVSFHHALTPHASGPNLTDAPRIGFAVRYAPTTVRQLAGPAISARLARGTDIHGHFRPETGPDAALSPRALHEHTSALAPHADTGYSTV
jgi:hypothetical protein